MLQGLLPVKVLAFVIEYKKTLSPDFVVTGLDWELGVQGTEDSFKWWRNFVNDFCCEASLSSCTPFSSAQRSSISNPGSVVEPQQRSIL